MTILKHCFNTQPPEGGWMSDLDKVLDKIVSTHSRPKAAGHAALPFDFRDFVSTHSRPKAAGRAVIMSAARGAEFQHTAARRRLDRAAPV